MAELPPLGADESYFRAEYGSPDFVRSEEESQLWRYDGDGCSLFVFLYRENDSAEFLDSPESAEPYILRYAETNPQGTDGAIDIACLSSIKEGLGLTS